VFLLLSSCTH